MLCWNLKERNSYMVKELRFDTFESILSSEEDIRKQILYFLDNTYFLCMNNDTKAILVGSRINYEIHLYALIKHEDGSTLLSDEDEFLEICRNTDHLKGIDISEEDAISLIRLDRIEMHLFNTKYTLIKTEQDKEIDYNRVDTVKKEYSFSSIYSNFIICSYRGEIIMSSKYHFSVFTEHPDFMSILKNKIREIDLILELSLIDRYDMPFQIGDVKYSLIKCKKDKKISSVKKKNMRWEIDRCSYRLTEL